MPDVLAIGVLQPGAVGLVIGLAAGALVGHWLAGRKRHHQSSGQSIPASAPSPAEATSLTAEATSKLDVARPSAPTAVADAPVPSASNDQADAATTGDHAVLPAEVQALIDKGEVFPALSQLRKLSGGLAARRLAREHLSSGRVPLPADIRRLADGGNKIGAIQALCEQTHMDLTLARELVERHAAAPR